MWPPPALITAWHLLGIEEIRFWQTSAGIMFHSSTKRSHKVWRLVGGEGYLLSCFLTWHHKCSIGFRSGDCDGHVNSWIPLSSNHFWAILEECLGSLSCWKYSGSKKCPNVLDFCINQCVSCNRRLGDVSWLSKYQTWTYCKQNHSIDHVIWNKTRRDIY